MVEKIEHENKILAILITRDYKSDSIEFFSPKDFPQQLGYMHRPKGYCIDPHVHNAIERVISDTQEVLYIKSGSIRIDFYNAQKEYLKSYILSAGDVILLASGGHGIEIIDDSEIIEIKQGPYLEERDKIRFDPIDPSLIKIKNLKQ